MICKQKKDVGFVDSKKDTDDQSAPFELVKLSLTDI